MNIISTFLSTLLDLWLDAAFWLIIGLVIAGLLKSFLSSNNLAHHFTGPGLWPAIKAAIMGTPLPLCSCGVIPAAIGLRRAGATKSSTTAFLISTPETGVDSISISYALLGPFMAIIRPIAAVTTAIVAAALVLFIDKEDEPEKTKTDAAKEQGASSCCSSGCSNKTSVPKEKKEHWWKKLWEGQRYAFGELIEDLSLWLVAGLVISALVVTFVPSEALAEISRGPWAMLLMAAIGVPMYICASASTPLAAGLMLAGVSPGAVLVFLLAGPATNMATLGIVHKELGLRSLISYLTGVVGVAIFFGYLTNFLIDSFSINIQAQLASSNQLLPPSIMWISGLVLTLIIANDFWKRLRPKTKQTSCCQ
ncbi:SO_0444 family Cu/Zn efflux transporter [Vibrio hannami]|uniref:SO_0444 family Cu/Zn efflux transporter n=1 Tax=Vibrio hannami TaxID=2717094 RepID=UPI00240F41A4|nr:SO_0444 family Cu/Zn efflux transporter [Vibrio hannami]MDG3086534.1 SO_0444 family Cu/Zn efflux transporter [Vibrio hannami]